MPLRLLSLALLLPLLGGLFTAPGAPVVRGDELSDAQAAKKSLEQKIAAQKAQISKLNALQSGLSTEIAQTRIQLNGITQDLGAKRRQITTMKSQIAQVQALYADLVDQLQQLDGQIDRVVQQEDEKRQDLATRKRLLAQRVRSAYETDQTSLLETFLSGGSFADILTEVSYYLDVGEQDKALADGIARASATLAALHDTVVETRAETDDLRAKTAAQKVRLDAALTDLKAAEAQLVKLERATAEALAAQRRAYAAAQKNKAALARALRASAAAQKKLQRKIDAIVASQYAHGNIPSAYNGSFIWPMAGTISQDFGCTGVPFEPPLGSCAHFHQGIDMVAPYGSPVRASGAGRVVYCGWNYADGADPAWIVIIAHSQRLETWYAHMVPSCPASTGSAVSRGQVIGHEGNTGHSTGAHLHWAVRMNGTFVNPRLFL